MTAEVKKKYGGWKPGHHVFICPPLKDDESDPCDCGFDGEWDYRPVFGWCDGDRGWWVINGWEERCPQCGDREEFDTDYNLVAKQPAPWHVHVCRCGETFTEGTEHAHLVPLPRPFER